VLALALNCLLLLALLSTLQATLTLPGIAAIALALGMAIDSNVLINERIARSCATGTRRRNAIAEGFRHAWSTILDSNVTTLIVGLALLVFGSGAVRGFAWWHCLGILTSMFSSVFFSRGVVNLWYGRRRSSANWPSARYGRLRPPPPRNKDGIQAWNFSRSNGISRSCATR